MKIKENIQKIKIINDQYTKWKWRERKLTGEKSHKLQNIYVVRRANARVGLFSLVLTTLGGIRYAVENGMIPLVDLSNYKEDYKGYFEENDNIWEYFFEQPSDILLEQAYKYQGTILGNGLIKGNSFYPKDDIAYDMDKLIPWRNFAHKYLIVKEEILIEVQKKEQELFLGKKVLGVLARGTDYAKLRPLNHPIQPTAAQLMEIIDEKLEKEKYDSIFLVTEDKEIFEEFKIKYTDMLLYLEADRYNTKSDENINDVIKKNRAGRYFMAKTYLINIVMLSRCYGIVGGNTSGSLGALIMSNGYADQYIFDLGVYK